MGKKAKKKKPKAGGKLLALGWSGELMEWIAVRGYTLPAQEGSAWFSGQGFSAAFDRVWPRQGKTGVRQLQLQACNDQVRHAQGQDGTGEVLFRRLGGIAMGIIVW